MKTYTFIKHGKSRVSKRHCGPYINPLKKCKAKILALGDALSGKTIRDALTAAIMQSITNNGINNHARYNRC